MQILDKTDDFGETNHNQAVFHAWTIDAPYVAAEFFRYLQSFDTENI